MARKDKRNQRAVTPNPLRAIRHADGFHQRVENKPRDPSNFTKLDDLCFGCFAPNSECECYDEGLDDG